MSTLRPTWEPHEKHGRLSMRSDLPDTVFAFPHQRKEPLTDAEHVRNAIARFDQVLGVPDRDRALALANIEKAARHYEMDLPETYWHQFGVHAQQHQKENAAEGVETKREHRVLEKAAARAAATRRRKHGQREEKFNEYEEF
jgi:Family of unknown function (DUF6582)